MVLEEAVESDGNTEGGLGQNVSGWFGAVARRIADGTLKLAENVPSLLLNALMKYAG